MKTLVAIRRTVRPNTIAEKSKKKENITEVFLRLHISTATKILAPGSARRIATINVSPIKSSNRIENEIIIGLKIILASKGTWLVLLAGLWVSRE